MRNAASVPVTESVSHVCHYREQLVWSRWSRSGALAERLARRVPLCDVCKTERPARKPRPPVLREVRAEAPESLPLADATGRMIAKSLARLGAGREGFLPVRGCLGDLARRGIPARLAEQWIDTFLRAGLITVLWTPGSPSRLSAVTLRKPKALRELARPGEETHFRSALQQAKARVASLTHPKAVEIAAILDSPDARRLPPLVIQALGAVAIHVEADEVLAERVFSTRYLGKPKALAGIRGRLERLVGPLAGIGIREGAGVTLLGGDGTLRLADREIGLRTFTPFLGLPREILENLEDVAFPAGGLFVVENLATFEACCRGEVAAARGALIAWSAGYPGRSIRKLVELAGATGAPLRVWADLDLDGVRIARLTASWYPGEAELHRMSPQDLKDASYRHHLYPRSVAAIRRELKERPEAPLADTLRALLSLGWWAEQEAFLARPLHSPPPLPVEEEGEEDEDEDGEELLRDQPSARRRSRSEAQIIQAPARTSANGQRSSSHSSRTSK